MSLTAVYAFAEAVEATLSNQGLQLTMGGEPTFITPQPDGAEWNNAAMGPEKLGYARRLAGRFLKKSYPGGLVMQIFGKQYPNEPLPRWVMLTLAPEDGSTLWSTPARFLLDDVKGSHKPAMAQKFIRRIARELGFSKNLLPAYEVAKRRRTRGWVLPLDYTGGQFVSDSWPFNPKTPLELFPGDSQIGLRLPLYQLGEDHLRRALTVEIAQGALMVFIPPLEWPGFHQLIGIIEAVATELDTHEMIFCGYKPYDTKGALREIGVAADPGVLEINLPPAATWRQYDRTLAEVEKAARAEGLSTLKLHLNGSVQGTGGGAHLIFGGPSLEANPFFAQPSLLASMVRYWQHHPSLAYFFTGQYVGPGSQAPRADETLISKLYELELACEGLEQCSGEEGGIFIDRLLRNLMTDSGGNTHRAEICLDKFWNMDSPSGRLGLVELRAFETCPRVRLQSFAALLIRAIIARLAREPFTKELIRHGSELQDRFMLPHVLWADLESICEDLDQQGLPFEVDWLRPIFDFKFPVLGELPVTGGTFTVRQALEPWPLMAEVAEAGFTSRVVDNSTDRLEISVSNPDLLNNGKLCVNGVPLTFHPRGGVHCAGVRYKCANGWPALHPHIKEQVPLSIEWVEEDLNKVIAAADYHYWNPDAPVYDGRPKTMKEALKRRKARWQCRTIKADAFTTPASALYSVEQVATLDLRRQA